MSYPFPRVLTIFYFIFGKPLKWFIIVELIPFPTVETVGYVLDRTLLYPYKSKDIAHEFIRGFFGLLKIPLNPVGITCL
jgi:hypothetical protein